MATLFKTVHSLLEKLPRFQSRFLVMECPPFIADIFTGKHYTEILAGKTSGSNSPTGPDHSSAKNRNAINTKT